MPFFSWKRFTARFRKSSSAKPAPLINHTANPNSRPSSTFQYPHGEHARAFRPIREPIAPQAKKAPPTVKLPVAEIEQSAQMNKLQTLRNELGKSLNTNDGHQLAPLMAGRELDRGIKSLDIIKVTPKDGKPVIGLAVSLGKYYLSILDHNGKNAAIKVDDATKIEVL